MHRSLTAVLAEGNIEVEEKKNSPFPAGPVIKCFVIPLSSIIEKKLRRNPLLDAGWLTNLQRFQGARPDHVRLESRCFLRELVSFARPKELVSFDPRQMTRFPPIGTRIWVGRYNKVNWPVLRSQEVSLSSVRCHMNISKLCKLLWKQEVEW